MQNRESLLMTRSDGSSPTTVPTSFEIQKISIRPFVRLPCPAITITADRCVLLHHPARHEDPNTIIAVHTALAVLSPRLFHVAPKAKHAFIVTTVTTVITTSRRRHLQTHPDTTATPSPRPRRSEIPPRGHNYQCLLFDSKQRRLFRLSDRTSMSPLLLGCPSPHRVSNPY